MKPLLITCLLLAVLCLPFLLPFFQAGYFQTDDGNWAVVRQASMHRELRQGQFPVRWSGDLNYTYGYPLFNFSYPAPYYLGEILHLIGLNFLNTVKALFIISTIFSIIGMYFFAKEMFKHHLAATIATLMYLAAPYRFINLYHRGSLGETIAFAIFPFLCLAILKLLQTGKRRFLLTGSVLLALLVTSHNALALLFFPFLMFFILVEIFLRYVKFNGLLNEYLLKIKHPSKDMVGNSVHTIFKRHVHLVLVMLLLGLGLSAFFWIPALSETKFTKLGQTPLTKIEDHFLPLEYVFPFASSTMFNQSTQNSALKEIGFTSSHIKNETYANLIILVTVVLLFFYKRKEHEVVFPRTLLYGLAYMLVILLILPFSLPIWKNIPLLKTIDFPWRLLGISFFIRAMTVASLALLPRARYFGIGLAISCLLLSLPLVQVKNTNTLPDTFYSTNVGTTTSAGEYLSHWITQIPGSHPKQFITSLNQPELPLRYQTIQATSLSRKITIKNEQTTPVQVALMYFPGWNLYLDQKNYPFTYTQNGLIQFNLPAGKHILDLRFERTPLRIASEAITVSTLIFLVGFFLFEYLYTVKKIRL